MEVNWGRISRFTRSANYQHQYPSLESVSLQKSVTTDPPAYTLCRKIAKDEENYASFSILTTVQIRGASNPIVYRGSLCTGPYTSSLCAEVLCVQVETLMGLHDAGLLCGDSSESDTVLGDECDPLLIDLEHTQPHTYRRKRSIDTGAVCPMRRVSMGAI